MNRGALIPGIILILLGGYFLASSLGVNIPDISMWWPLIVVAGGVFALSRYFTDGRKDSDNVFVGVGGIGVGLFLFYIVSLGNWALAGTLWPVWVLIAGIAFIAKWVADRRERQTLWVGTVGVAIGAVFLAGTALAPDNDLTRYWPVILIALGAVVLLNSLFGKRSS